MAEESPLRQLKGNSASEEELLTEKALLGRPSFSIRLRITSAFALAMFFSLAIGVASIVFISRMDSRQGFFEQAENFSAQIQEARRYEKNYFLYGSRSDLDDALSHIRAASGILERTADIRSVLKPAAYAALTDDLNQYEDLLGQLAVDESDLDSSAGPRDPDREGQLRRVGHRILSYAADTVKQERNNMRATASSLRLVAISALAINLIVTIWVATELTRQILRPLGRAVEYTQRIATGDFSLITPKRKYRDEFSNLAIAINRMILELRRNQEQLIQSRKLAAVGTLTSGIAHELNNPLNNISITTEALLEMGDDYSSGQTRKMLSDIFTQAERASGTVRNLLDFTRSDHSRLESMDVAELVRASLCLVGNELTLNHIEARTEFADRLPRVRGHFRDLQQLFLNLFLNAIQAMPEGGRLSVLAGVEKGEYVRVDVTDTGCGIPQECIDRIFEPFFTTKPMGLGTGLGLSVSYGIIQDVGGRIEVDSEEGKGTTFSVFLQIDDGSA
jgi:two-component system NtrC family sensor kinase